MRSALGQTLAAGRSGWESARSDYDARRWRDVVITRSFALGTVPITSTGVTGHRPLVLILIDLRQIDVDGRRTAWCDDHTVQS